MKTSNEFKLYSRLTNKSVSQITKTDDDAIDDSERILLTGVASTTSRDLQDEIVSSEAIQSMKDQALNLNIHGDHWYGLEDVIGAIKDVNADDDILSIKFLITKRHTPAVKDLLETGVNLGLSIGGYVTDYDSNNNIIKAIELREISLTAMPANWDTFGTVTTSKGITESTCLTGACYNIIKNNFNGENNMTKEESTKADETQDTSITLEDVKNFLDEYMAEKESAMVEEVTNSVKSNVETIVEAKVKELLDEPTEEQETPEEEETKAEEEEEEKPKEEDEEDKDDDANKTLTSEDIASLISKGISDALGDNFADTVASKMWNNMDQNRSTNGSKFDAFMKSQNTEESVEDNTQTSKSTYTVEETAKALYQRQGAANPIMAAAFKNMK
jgi:hypothetical protein